MNVHHIKSAVLSFKKVCFQAKSNSVHNKWYPSFAWEGIPKVEGGQSPVHWGFKELGGRGMK